MKLEAWCKAHGIRMITGNTGQHWRFYHDGQIAHWWPTTKKFFFNMDFGDSRTVSTAAEAAGHMRSRWKLERLDS